MRRAGAGLAVFALLTLGGCTNLRYVETPELWAQSETRFDAGNYDDSIPYYDELIRRDETNAQAYLMRGVAHEREGETRQALADYHKAADLGDVRGLLYAANLNIVTGNTSAAEEDLARLRERDLGGRDRVIQLTLLGTLRLRQGQYRMAAQNLERAVEAGAGALDPGSQRHVRDAHMNAAQAYYRLGDFGRAYDHLLAYAGAEPGGPAPSLDGEDAYLLGLTAYLAGDFAAADAYLAQADAGMVAEAQQILDDPSFGAARREGLK